MKNRSDRLVSQKLEFFAVVAVLFGVMALTPQQAWAEWNFCVDPEISETEEGLPPAAFLMLDRSWSMDSSGLWPVAVASIDAVVLSLQHQLMFGLGLYPVGSNSTGATEALSFREAAHADIKAILEGTDARGMGTPTDDALEVSRQVLQANPDLAVGAVLITDGEPGDVDDAIDEACATRDAGFLQYVVGLGGGTDDVINNTLAAAAGTGCCGATAEEGCPHGIGLDPCDSGFSESDRNTCVGSYHAYDQPRFEEILLNITQQISCTFPLDTSQWPEGVPDNPEAIQVHVKASAGMEVVHHRDSPEAEDREGWYFASSNRDQITFTEDYCERSADPNDISEVHTNVACNCLFLYEGQECVVPDVGATTCPIGAKRCNADQTWVCVETGEEVGAGCSAFACPSFTEPVFCHVDNEIRYRPDYNGHGPHLYEEGDANWGAAITRCDVGVITCDEAIGGWCEPLKPMPELCNGLDDSCDGQVDNLSTGSFTSFDGMSMAEDAEYPGAACYERDICSCPDGRGKHGGVGETAADEFNAYIDAYEPTCVCSEGIGG